jgi:hypothetical protein
VSRRPNSGLVLGYVPSSYSFQVVSALPENPSLPKIPIHLKRHEGSRASRRAFGLLIAAQHPDSDLEREESASGVVLKNRASLRAISEEMPRSLATRRQAESKIKRDVHPMVAMKLAAMSSEPKVQRD